MLEFKDFLIEETKGTYCGAWFNKDSQKVISNFCQGFKIPNPVPMNKLHVTILYSRKYLPDFKPEGYYQKAHIAKPVGFEIWKSKETETSPAANCLVLKLDCPSLVERHKFLMKQHNATFDYPEYKVHVTLSYNVGDLNLDKLNHKDISDLTLEREYKEELNLNWAKDNT